MDNWFLWYKDTMNQSQNRTTYIIISVLVIVVFIIMYFLFLKSDNVDDVQPIGVSANESNERSENTANNINNEDDEDEISQPTVVRNQESVGMTTRHSGVLNRKLYYRVNPNTNEYHKRKDITYDVNGNVVEENDYEYSFGAIDASNDQDVDWSGYERKYHYRDDGKLERVDVITDSSSLELTDYILYAYNDDGSLSTTSEHRNGKIYEVVEYEYFE